MSSKKTSPLIRGWRVFLDLPENWNLSLQQKSERWKKMKKAEKMSYDHLPVAVDEYSASEWEQIRAIRAAERAEKEARP